MLKSWNSICPILGIFDFDNKDSLKSEWRCHRLSVQLASSHFIICRKFHNLDDEVRNVSCRVIRKLAPVQGDYVALGRGEESCEDHVFNGLVYVIHLVF